MKCKVCGAPHAVCGPRTTSTPVDSRIERAESAVGTLKTYEVPAGRRGEYTGIVQLDDEAVKRLEAAGVKPKAVDVKASAQKSAPAAKSRRASNKSRTAANKASKPAAAKAADAASSGDDASSSDAGDAGSQK